MSAFSRTFSIPAKSECLRINEIRIPILRGARLAADAALHRPAPNSQLPCFYRAEYVGRK